MKITDFYNEEYMLAALYTSFRSIANCIDGLKPSGRKVISTIEDFNIKSKIKVSQLASKVSETKQYLHGEDSLGGVVVGLAQTFIGSNNVNLLVPDGNFGSRYVNSPSASRYIYTYKSDSFDLVFNKDDTPILEEQYFEGEKIEYKYYVPILPLILINGSEGIGNGFAQKILPRSIEDIKKEIEAKLSSTKYKIKSITPYFKGFKGVIRPNSEPHKWIVEGRIERVGTAKLRITEVPIGYDLKSYLLVLDDLTEKKVIKSYDDNCKDDEFDFTLSVTKEFLQKQDNEILEDLRLVKTISENYTCTNENNTIIEFDSDSQILNYFIDVRLKFYNKRKKYLLDKINSDIIVVENKVKFIHAVVADTSIVVNKKKTEIEKYLLLEKYNKIDDSYDYLLRMPIYSLTSDKINELEKELKHLQKEITSLESKTPKKLWIEDLNKI